MTRIAQIEDRAAALAWSPVSSQSDVIALGSKDSGGIGFDDHGGDLEFYSLGINGDAGRKSGPQVVGSIKTTSRFSSIDWTPLSFGGRYPMGLLAGGMVDGTVQLWDPARVLDDGGGASSSSESNPITVIKEHSGGKPVTAVSFNQHYDSTSAALLATGGADGTVLINSLERPDRPDVFSPDSEAGGGIGSGGGGSGAEVTKLAWNSQVAHIVASASGDGSVAVWDLKQKKMWCDIRCGGGMAVTDLAWNPTEGLHLITASGDDRNPVMKLWDLRASTSMPLATLEGHTGGVLGLAWCPHDSTLLLSCGKDNRTLLWDLYTLKPIDELGSSSEDAASSAEDSAGGMYGGSLGSSSQRRYDVQWSPLKRGVVSTCSIDRRVEAHSVIGAVNQSGRPPSWLKCPSGVSCGFGGAVVSFGAKDRAVKIDHTVEEPPLKRVSDEFERAMASRDFTAVCTSKAEGAAQAGDAYEAQVWGFMQIIFEANARVQILNYLGFDPARINQMAMEYNEDLSSNGVSSLSLDDGEKPTPPMSKKAEEIVKDALLVGDFEAAVECCFRSGNLADALVLSSCGGAELWAKTQAEYFSREAKKRPFLSVVSAVIHNQLGELVAASDPSKWQETLAILSTYGKSDEFPSLCLALGSRLEEGGDPANASLCYMCALDLDRAVRHWKSQLDQNFDERLGRHDLLALHNFVEKVTVFLNAPEVNAVLAPEIADLFSVYAKTLAEQGLMETAARYCRAESQASNELRDRLYHSGAGQGCRQVIGSPPAFPFYRVNVGVAPKTSTTGGRAGSRQQQQQQRASNQRQQPKSDQLPPGWVALQDPGSGRTYYANQTTGESSWEKPAAPAPAPAPTRAPAPTPARAQPQPTYQQQAQQPYQQQQTQQQAQQPYQPQAQQQYQQQAQQQPYQQQTAHQPQQQYQQQNQQQQQQPVANGGNAAPTPTRGLASKYGDGFVSSSSHPELAQQYGNVGTSNPYTGTARPGIAAVSNAVTKAAPVSGTFDPNIVSQLSGDVQPIGDDLLAVVSSLGSCPLGTSERKQLAEIQKGVAIFMKKAARGSVDAATIEKVGLLVTAVQNKEYAVASGIQTGLVNTDWSEHKDWIKGMKFLIQLAMKKQI